MLSLYFNYYVCLYAAHVGASDFTQQKKICKFAFKYSYMFYMQVVNEETSMGEL